MGTTPRLSLPYPESTDPPAGSQQIRALADTLDAIVARTFTASFTIPAGTVPSGGVFASFPQSLLFTGAGFTAPPTVYLEIQNLPASAPFVRPMVTAITAAGCQVWAYNISNTNISTGSPITVALLALQRS